LAQFVGCQRTAGGLTVIQNIGGQRVWSKLAHGPQAAQKGNPTPRGVIRRGVRHVRILPQSS
jgi:hypothetical protein